MREMRDNLHIINISSPAPYFLRKQARNKAKRGGVSIMNNRLGDIPIWATMEGSSDDEEIVGGQDASTSNNDIPHPITHGRHKREDIELQILPSSSSPSPTTSIFCNIDTINIHIDKVRKATEQINYLHDETLKSTSTEKEHELVKQQLKPLIDTTNKRLKRIKALLSHLKDETKQLKQKGKITPCDLRIRENMYTTATKKIVNEMKLYQAAQQTYKSNLKKKAARQVRIVKPDATDADIDTIMKNEGGRDALYRQTILTYGVNNEIKATYTNVAEKYQDIVTLESSMAQLHEMFLDLALLTENQGEILDQIEFQVNQAEEYVVQGNDDIHQGIQTQKKIRKKKCWTIGIAAVCIFLITLVLFA